MEYEHSLEDAWRYIRACRHDPPAFASSDKNRRLLFIASLKQSEEFFRASDSASYEIKPILQYYGLNQAGRALTAAGLDPRRAWTYRGHGLRCSNISNETEIGQLSIEGSKGESAFSTLSSLLGSPKLTQPTTMREIWMSLPEGTRVPLQGSHETWRAAKVVPATPENRFTTEPHVWEATLQFAPGDLRTASHETLSAEVLGRYPALKTLGIDVLPELLPDLIIPGEKHKLRVRLSWQCDAAKRRYADEQASSVRAVGYSNGADNSFWLIPCLNVNKQPLHTMATWFTILHTMSLLARYEPSTWTRALDVDSSPDATAVEYLLDEAHHACANLIRMNLHKRRMVAAGWPSTNIRG